MINKMDIYTYLETIFNKSYKKITKEELMSVSKLVIPYSNFDNPNNKIELSKIIDLMPNVKEITINDKALTLDIFNELSKLKLVNLCLNNCSIPSNISLKIFEYLKEITLFRCALLDFSIIETINEKIEIINIIDPIDEKEINMSLFSKFKDLMELRLEKCIINNVKEIALEKLAILSLFNSDILDIQNIGVLNKLKSLKEIYIHSEYKNLEVIKELASQKKVYYDYRHLTFED